MAEEAPDGAVEETAEDLDLPSLEERIDWFDQWEEKTRDNREKAIRDRQYYDGIQWTQEEIDKLIERNQPVITKNRIARKINFILGEEIKKRVDPVALPRGLKHEDSARVATDALRFVEEEQEFDQVRSSVFRSMMVEGYGGAIKRIDEDGKHVLTHVEWDRLFYDPHSRASDFSDARYRGIVIWQDLEDAVMEFPGAEAALRAAVTRAGVGSTDDTTEDSPRRWADGRRKRVKICEMYFRWGKNYYQSFFTEDADLEPPQQTAYLNEKMTRSVCPLLMASCYIDRDGLRYGLVRNLVSPQDELNKRSSKALDATIRRSGIYERDTITDPQKFLTELAKTDGFAEVEPGTLVEGRIQIPPAGEIAQSQILLMQEAKQEIDSIGPSAATMPDLPESISGRAFIARQSSAAQELGTVFDSLRYWTKKLFELDWLCIRQYWTEEKWLRVTDNEEMDGYRFVALNQRMTRAQRLMELAQKQPPVPPMKALEIAAGDIAPVVIAATQAQHQAMQQQAAQQAQALQQQGAPPEVVQQAQAQMQQLQSPQHLIQMLAQHPLMQEEITVNQVDQMLVDIIIEVAPDTAVVEQEEFGKLAEIIPSVIQARPDIAPLLVKTLIKASQLRSKKEILQALDKPQDPEQQQLAEISKQLQMAQAKAGVAVTESQAQLNAAKAQGEQAKAQIAGAKAPSEIGKNEAQAMKDAAHAGSMSVPMNPAIT